MGSSISIVTPDLWYCKIGYDGAIPDFFVHPDRNTDGVLSAFGEFQREDEDIKAKMTEAVGEYLVSKNYAKIVAGKKYTWGGQTLSLWRQGTCVQVALVDTYTVRAQTLVMHPIFSGATAGSDLEHDIAYWLNKNSVETAHYTIPHTTIAPEPEHVGEVPEWAEADHGGSSQCSQ